jgi:amidase
MVAKWEEIAQQKRASLLYTIPNEWIIPDNIKPPDSQLDVTGFPQDSGWFTSKELEITSKSATDLLGKTTTGQWSAEEVTLAFCKRASAAQQLVPLLVHAQAYNYEANFVIDELPLRDSLPTSLSYK